MNREIKFRGKVKHNGNHLFSGDWVTGSLVIKTRGVFIYVIEEDEFGNILREFEVEVDPETVGMYITNDSKGKEVYKDDLVKVLSMGIIRKVFFNKCSFGVMITDSIFAPIYEAHDIEKVGNIHDNPELL